MLITDTNMSDCSPSVICKHLKKDPVSKEILDFHILLIVKHYPQPGNICLFFLPYLYENDTGDSPSTSSFLQKFLPKGVVEAEIFWP